MLNIVYTNLSLMQKPHDGFERRQRCGIGRERPQDGRPEAPREAPPAPFLINVLDGVDVVRKLLLCPDRAVGHNHLLHHISRIGEDPEDRGRQPAGPEIDGRPRHGCVFSKVVGEDLVRAPPKDKVGAEHHGAKKPGVPCAGRDLPQLFRHVEWARVYARLGVVLDLEPGLKLFDGRRNKRNSPSTSETGNKMAGKRKLFLLRVDVFHQQTAVQVERTKHHRIHKHPAHQWRRETFVETSNSLASKCLPNTVHGAFEPALGCLETHFDRIKRMADGVFGHSGKHSSYEAKILGRVFFVGHG